MNASTFTRQEAAVFKLFVTNPCSLFTPFEVHRRTGLRCPITSVRRAITDLTTAGYLKKTGTMKPGEYGKPNHTWKLSIDKAKWN